MSSPVVVRDRGSSTEIDPLDEGPMSVRELATLAATRLGRSPDSIWTLVDADRIVLNLESIAPTSGTYELVEIGSGV